MTVTVVDEVTPTSAAPVRGAGEQDYSNSSDAWAASITVTTTSWNASIAQFNIAAIEINALAVATEANANSAIAAANAVLWVNGNNYVVGDGVYSPITLLSYRAKTAQTPSTTDPSLDPTNWKDLSSTLPTQTGNAGKFLGTDGAAESWLDILAADKVADGGITLGNPTALTAAGKVEIISGTVSGVEFGSAAVFESAAIDFPSNVFDSVNNKTAVFYKDEGNSNFLTACFLTVDPITNVTTPGTPIVLHSVGVLDVDATFDLDTAQVLVVYRISAGSAINCIVAGLSGATITAGTGVQVIATGTYPRAAYDEGEGKGLVVYSDSNTDGFGKVITVTGTVPSFGSAVGFEVTTADHLALWYDSTAANCIVAFQENTADGHARVVTITGTTPSYGAVYEFDGAGSVNLLRGTHDVTANKSVLTYRENYASGYGTAVVLTVSGTTLTGGTPVTIIAGKILDCASAYNSSAGHLILAASNNSDSSMMSSPVTIIGTVPSFAFSTVAGVGRGGAVVGISYDSNINRTIGSFEDHGNSSFGTSFVIVPEWTTNADKFFGIAQATVLDTETVTNKTLGAVDTNQSLGAFSIGDKLWLNPADGSFSNTDTGFAKVGTVLSATDLFITQEAA